VGENGSGKSTLVEAIAVAAGFNPEGGSFDFATRPSESSLGGAMRIGRAPGRERSSFFLRAESYHNVAMEIENLRLDRVDAYDGVSPTNARTAGRSWTCSSTASAPAAST
jgi:predicted ATPase